MTESDQSPALSIGVVSGDYNFENKAWEEAIRVIMKAVIATRGAVESPLRLNVVYHLDGKHAPNEFSGVRTSRFRGRDAT